jgi:hypothetical protein
MFESISLVYIWFPPTRGEAVLPFIIDAKGKSMITHPGKRSTDATQTKTMCTRKEIPNRQESAEV